MFNNLPKYLNNYIMPKFGKLKNNYNFLQFQFMKCTPAFYIILKGFNNGKITKKTTIIESSSGNFAFGLALICSFLKLKLIIVGDNAIDAKLRNKLRNLGTKLILVKGKSIKNIQSKRLSILKKKIKSGKNYFWPKQYDNNDNIKSYGMLKEFIKKKLLIKKFDYIVCAVGSGGSSAGFYSVFKKFNSKIKLVGVDSVNSIIFGNKLGPRLLRGPGSSIYPKNVKYNLFNKVFWVSDAEAYTSGINLFSEKKINSSPCLGAVHLVADYLSNKFPKKKIIAIFPETGERYKKSMYNLKWLKKKNLLLKKKFKPIKKTKISQDLKKFSYINWNYKIDF